MAEAKTIWKQTLKRSKQPCQAIHHLFFNFFFIFFYPVQFRFIGQSFNATVLNAHQINTLSEPKLLNRIRKFTLYSHFLSNTAHFLSYPVQFRFIGQSFNATVLNAHQINTLSEQKLLNRLRKFTLYSHFLSNTAHFLSWATSVNNQHFTSNFDESDKILIHPCPV